MEDNDLLNHLLTNVTISVSSFKQNPVAAIVQAKGKPVAVLSHNKPVFYCITPDFYEYLMNNVDK